MGPIIGSSVLSRATNLIVPVATPFLAASPRAPFIAWKAQLVWALVVWLIGHLIISRPRLTPISAVFFLYVAWAAIADMCGVQPLRGLLGLTARHEGLPVLILAGLYLCSVSGVAKDEWQEILAAWILSATAVSLSGILQGGLRPGGMAGNANFLAEFAMFGLGFAVIAWGRSGMLMLVFTIFAAAILIASSRSVIVGCAAGVLAGAVASGPNKRQWIAILGIISCGIAYTVSVRTGHYFVGADPTGGRLSLWWALLPATAQSPWVGWGQENIAFVAAGTYVDRAYNLPIDLLIAGGIPSLVLFATVLVLAFRKARSPAALGVLVAYTATSLFTFDTAMSYMPLMALLGWLNA